MTQNTSMNNYQRILLLLVLFTLSSIKYSSAQIAINEDSSNPDPSAMLDIKSIDKGLLLPRMNTSQRESITNPAEGLIVYDTDVERFFYFDEEVWVDIQAESISGRSINISASSIPNASLTGAGRGRIESTLVIELSNNADHAIDINVPLPADFVSGFDSFKVLYSSTTSTGNFRIGVTARAYGNTSALGVTTSEALRTIPSPSTAQGLAMATLDTGVVTNSNSEMFTLRFRRRGSATFDTSNGRLEIIGFIFDYEGE